MENCRTFFSNKTKEKDEHIDEQDQWKNSHEISTLYKFRTVDIKPDTETMLINEKETQNFLLDQVLWRTLC